MIKILAARDPHEAGRAATPLELLFDLCFVVAIAQAAVGLHHGIAENHILEALMYYLLVFFAIWWAWMNFTWFASAFDNDDSIYRLKVLIQMTGLLVLSAGIPRAFNQHDFTLITAGYTIIRLGMIAMWWRASKDNPEFKTTSLRYAFGLTLCQIGWIAIAFLDVKYWLYGWAVFATAELAVPVVAEKARSTDWHPHHIAERYGLLLIIVIGESVLGGTMSVQAAIDAADHQLDYWPVIIGAPIIFFSLWWIYFTNHAHFKTSSSKKTFIWGYSHYVIFGAAAAVGSGIGVATDYYSHHAHVSSNIVGLSVSIPAAIYLVFVCLAQRQLGNISKREWLILILGSIVCLLSGFIPYQPIGTAVILAIITGLLVYFNDNVA